MNEIRQKKVESLILNEIAKMILMGDVKDPRISTLISVTKVRVSHDMSFAKVYISSFESEKKRDKAVEVLNHAAGYISSKLGKRIKTRSTPKLSFYSDSSIEDSFEINRIINEQIKPDA